MMLTTSLKKFLIDLMMQWLKLSQTSKMNNMGTCHDDCFGVCSHSGLVIKSETYRVIQSRG
jgi:hypothetical protein